MLWDLAAEYRSLAEHYEDLASAEHRKEPPVQGPLTEMETLDRELSEALASSMLRSIRARLLTFNSGPTSFEWVDK